VREGDEAGLDEPDFVIQGRISLLFRPGNASLPALETCRAVDFRRNVWSGRWTRPARNDNCEDVDDAGQYRCLEPEHPCEAPWCDGPLGALESNGWGYSQSAIERAVVREVDSASISRSSSITLDTFSLDSG
jgi:hypothetical protein